MTLLCQIKPPTVPHFCTVVIDGKENTVSLARLTEKQINEYADMVRQRIVDYWKSEQKIKETINNISS